MKNFFKSIFIFFSPLLFLCLGVSIALIIVSKYVIKNSNQYDIIQNKELIFLGDSHITFSIIDSLIPNSSNLSNLGEPYYYTFQKLKYVVKNQNIKHVVLGVSYHNISYYYEELINGNSSTVFPIKIFFCLDFIEKLRVVSWNRKKLFFLFREIINSVDNKCSNLNPVDDKYSFSTGYKNNLFDEKVIIKNVENRAHSQFFTSQNQLQSFSYNNIYYLKKIISFCKENSLKITALTTPLHPEYLRLVPHKFSSELKEIIKKNNVQLINLENLELNDSCYAHDGDHLTLKGARRMTDSLINCLKFNF